MYSLNSGKVFIVAEIGQNHQGSVDVAQEMIKTAKDCGADCVKFQRSNLSEKFTAAALARPYAGSNSWGTTYGEHKAFLEFSLDKYWQLQRYAADLGILFTASAMDMASFYELETLLCVPFIKIGSGDADNLPLLRYAAGRSIPIVVSTGMQDWEHICSMYNILRERKNVAMLHCVSAYPTSPEDSMLQLIPLYRKHFPELTIGYSGHELGVQLSVASVALGAKIVERHFTLDKSWKGTDHRASLDPPEFARMVRYIRAIEGNAGASESIVEKLRAVLDVGDFDEAKLQLALKKVAVKDRVLLESEKPCHSKLGKSLVYSRNLPAGSILAEGDIGVKVSEPQGLSPRQIDTILGKKLKEAVSMDNPAFENHFV
ncbi:sialic acid synthase [Anopheles ziemanni]|uniref:sialic acid synthase n=1 Tax=Anopheles coustani TaxID=139045 RepID=UPI0026586D84|nr:sialic acid synthase [Anopheles coustani]XP_058169112.1 sialic acid synthase [Anopheles ziemanni]